jgi:glycosyltransferase involved in cell wall biosynthesis
LRGMRGRKPRFVTTAHGLNSPSRYSAIMARGERVICVSGCVRDYLLRHYPQTDPGRLVVIPRGVDPRAFPRAPMPDSAARARIAERHPPLAGDGPLLLMPGRGTRLKGHADAIALLANLRASGIDARLWMPGAVQDGREAYLSELADLAEAADVEDALAITEATDDIVGAYAASDVVLQLSRKPESFGRTVIEALSVGRPVLGWAHGGVGELLRALQPGGAVPPFDMAALANAARQLLAHPPAAAATMQLYRLDAMQEATLALYQSLVDA